MVDNEGGFTPKPCNYQWIVCDPIRAYFSLKSSLRIFITNFSRSSSILVGNLGALEKTLNQC